MPPPMPNPSKRITANPIRPARYRPGKAAPESESSDEEEEEEEQPPSQKPAHRPQSRPQPQRLQAPARGRDIDDDDDDDDEEGFETDEEDSTLPVAPPKTIAQPSVTGRVPVIQATAPLQRPITKSGSDKETSEDESEEEDESSEEEDSSSEDEAPQRKFQRPTFIKKADRQHSLNTTSESAHANASISFDLAASSTPEVDEQARRLAQADLLIKDKLERDALARAQGKKAWDDDEEVAPEDMVDDTDGLDPEAEYAAWKLRELKRLKRDREAIEAREKEIEEIERRRNLTQEERDREDREYLDKQREEREDGRAKANYMAKYHHKGAFFQDDEMAEILKKRDVMGARFEDEASDKSALPEYMRIRDMTKLGKKGRTRYTDLKNEDTGRFGEAVKRWRGSGYEGRDGQQSGAGTDDLRGVDERFLPDRDRDARGPTGANASAVGQRKERRDGPRSRSRSPRRRRRSHSRDRGDSYRPRQRSHSRSRSRSRDPPRRKRSPSPYEDRDKRRRIEVD